MTQPFHFTPKAIEAMLSYPCPGAPGTAAGLQYIAGKLRNAQVFVLSDGGRLLDPMRTKPEMPPIIFKPPFPVVALEYVITRENTESLYAQVPAPKRIALAWEYEDDLPDALSVWSPQALGPGVMIASICCGPDGLWLAVPVAAHVGYDTEWVRGAPLAPFVKAAIAAGTAPRAGARTGALPVTYIVLQPESVSAMMAKSGVATTQDMLQHDLSDEMIAYTDLCYALACKNVEVRERPAPANLNRNRIKQGKLPLKGFHVLELFGGGEMGGSNAGGDRGASRAHLRRGHIRRLSADRVTWVNQTMVRGRGFVEKVYAA